VPETTLSFRPLRHFDFPSSATGGGNSQCYQTEPHLDIIPHKSGDLALIFYAVSCTVFLHS